MEEKNADFWLQEETKPKILKIIIKEMISKHADAVGDKETGTTYMLQHKRLDGLQLMYRCFNRDAETKPKIILKMKPYIIERGSKIITDEENLKEPLKYVQNLLDLKFEMDRMIEFSFQNDTKFQEGCKDAFETFLEKYDSGYRAPGFMAEYCDHDLTKGLKGLSHDESERKLDRLVNLIMHTQQKDLFIGHYTEFLKDRLLNNTLLAQDLEESMHKKLKVELGHQTASKMGTMYKDITLSKNDHDAFVKEPRNKSI